MKQFWISWIHKYKFSAFEIHYPWWESGFGDNFATVVAAIKANSEEEAEEFIYKAYDKRPKYIEFRFCNEFTGSPYSDRFPKADWHKWD